MKALLQKFSLTKKSIGAYIDRNPFKSFFWILGLFVLLIVLGNLFGNPKPEEAKKELQVKSVQLYPVGRTSRMKVSAQIEKSSVVTVTAQTPGVVSFINKFAGSKANKGQTVVSLASNFQGGNASSLQRQIAEVSYKNTLETKDAQLALLARQKEAVEQGNMLAAELRTITDKSVGETNELVNVASEIIDSLRNTIDSYEQQGAPDSDILPFKQMLTQYISARNLARQGARMAEYNAASGNAPAEVANTQKDIALGQLALQEKMIHMNLEISRLQLAIARVVEGMMFPAAPFAGTIERVFVYPGQAVNPGTPLFVVSGDVTSKPTVAVAYVTKEIAAMVSKTEEAELVFDRNTIVKTKPEYVSTNAVSGALYGVYFTIDPEYAEKLTDKSFVTVDLPVGYAKTGEAIPFVPIDAIYQTKDESYVFIFGDGVAESKQIILGEVIGTSVEVISGLRGGDKVILNRNIIAGDRVQEEVQ